MKVKDLKKLLKDIPDNYNIKTRSENAHLCDDESLWQLNFQRDLIDVKRVDIHNLIMLIHE